jgi:hypothetical protein
VLLGAVAAVCWAGGWKSACVYGYITGTSGPAIVNAFLDPVLKRIGLPPAAATPAPVEEEGSP